MDVNTCEDIFKLYYQDLYGYGLKLCGKPELVKGVIQDLFATILERKTNLTHVNSIKAYLLASLRRRILKRLKKIRYEGEIIESLRYQPAIYFNIEEIIIKDELEEERKKKINSAINKLSDREKEVIYLRFYNGMSYEEIEDILSINYQSARNYVYRALKNLRTLLDKDYVKVMSAVFIGLILRLPI